VRLRVWEEAKQAHMPIKDDGGVGPLGWSQHDLPLGSSVCSRTGQTLPTSSEVRVGYGVPGLLQSYVCCDSMGSCTMTGELLLKDRR
jgi:hypothetical protein